MPMSRSYEREKQRMMHNVHIYAARPSLLACVLQIVRFPDEACLDNVSSCLSAVSRTTTCKFVFVVEHSVDASPGPNMRRHGKNRHSTCMQYYGAIFWFIACCLYIRCDMMPLQCAR